MALEARRTRCSVSRYLKRSILHLAAEALSLVVDARERSAERSGIGALDDAGRRVIEYVVDARDFVQNRVDVRARHSRPALRRARV